MTDQNKRRPFGNFLIKKKLQLTLILRVILVISIAATVTTALLAYAYNRKAQQGSFYYMSNDVREDIKLTSILGLILPSVITAQVVSILIGAGIGLFASRKMAVPVYKFEKWVTQLQRGNLKTSLGFRENGQLKELAITCNTMTESYRMLFSRMKRVSDEIESCGDETLRRSPQVKELRRTLDTFSFE